MSTKKAQAIEAVTKANPKWSERHVAYAVELMPTSIEYVAPEGSAERAYWRAEHQHRWTLWAIEMNILPEGTPIPPKPESNETPVARNRRGAAQVLEDIDMALYVQGFDTEAEAQAHAQQYGGPPIAEQKVDDGKWYPLTFQTRQEAYNAIKQYDVVGGYPRGLRNPTTGHECYGIGINKTKLAAAKRAESTPRAPAGPEQNGIPLPKVGTAGDAAWKLCDELMTKLGRVPTPAEAREAGATAGLNPGNCGTELSRWRKYHGHPK